MGTNKFYRFFLFLLFCFPLQAATLTPTLDKIVKHYRVCELKCLENNVEAFIKINGIENTEELTILYHILKAEQYSQKIDQLNQQSERNYSTGLTKAKRLNNTALILWSESNFGFYYYKYSELVKALPLFLASSKIIETNPDLEGIEPIDILKKNAYFFGNIEDFHKEIAYLEMALLQINPKSDQYASLLYSLGVSYHRQKQYAKAEVYFIETRDHALQNKQQLEYAKAIGELGQLEALKKNYAKAEKLLRENIQISKEIKNYRNLMFAQLQLGKLYIELKQMHKATTVLKEAEDFAKTKAHLSSFQFEINELLLKIAIQNKDEVTELSLRRTLDSLNQHIEATDGESVVKQLNWQAQKERVKWQLEAEQAKLEKASLLQWAWLTVSILFFVVSLLIFVLYKRKLKHQSLHFDKSILSFQLAQMQSEKKLGDTQNTLASYTIYLSEKNKQIIELEKELTKVKKTTLHSSVEKQNTLIDLLDSHLMTKEKWLHFKGVFIEEKPEYYDYLMLNFPGLTEANLRIILLQKLGLTNIETAHVLGVTVDAVKKSKQRLRKRFEETYDELLTEG